MRKLLPAISAWAFGNSRARRADPAPEACRLCGGATEFRFAMDVLKHPAIGFFVCRGCGSLQTEKPFWLDGAYAIPGVHVDVGQALRVMQTWIRLCFLLQQIGFDRDAACVDYGGSMGLLTRLMRDSGYNYFSFDRYEASKFANYHQVDSLAALKPRLVSAFEVFEHLPEPAAAFREMLAGEPELLAFSTLFYEGQGSDWDYLAAFCGQHIFFYTQKALEDFFGARGYVLRRTADLWVFVRAAGPYRAAIDAHQGSIPGPDFGAELLARVGWGTEHTDRDYRDAKDRFVRELHARRTS